MSGRHSDSANGYGRSSNAVGLSQKGGAQEETGSRYGTAIIYYRLGFTLVSSGMCASMRETHPSNGPMGSPSSIATSGHRVKPPRNTPDAKGRPSLSPSEQGIARAIQALQEAHSEPDLLWQAYRGKLIVAGV